AQGTTPTRTVGQLALHPQRSRRRRPSRRNRERGHMAADGPPWLVGQNCNVTLRHPAVNGNVATGFYVKPDSFRVLLPKVWYRGTNVVAVIGASPIAAGKHVMECIVVARDGLIH